MPTANENHNTRNPSYSSQDRNEIVLPLRVQALFTHMLDEEMLGGKLPYLAARTFCEFKGHQFLSEPVRAMLQLKLLKVKGSHTKITV